MLFVFLRIDRRCLTEIGRNLVQPAFSFRLLGKVPKTIRLIIREDRSCKQAYMNGGEQQPSVPQPYLHGCSPFNASPVSGASNTAAQRCSSGPATQWIVCVFSFPSFKVTAYEPAGTLSSRKGVVSSLPLRSRF